MPFGSRGAAVCMAVVLSASACGPSDSGKRTVRVDHRNDEFASYYWRFFPKAIDAHPGDTVVFKQEWTGEPHTVTMGSLVDKALPVVEAIERKYSDLERSPENAPVLEQAEKEYAEAIRGLPAFDVYAQGVAQNGAQPCYLASGAPPAEPEKPCAKPDQRQEEFTGRQSYYSSGFIPFSGPNGNEYRVRLSSDIKPGTYRFICLTHFPAMQGSIVVKPESEPLDSQQQLARRTRSEIEALSDPLRKAFEEAKQGKAEIRGQPLPRPLAGYHSGEEFTVAINEFMPSKIEAQVGEKMTWTMVGAHSISFDVPRYLPIYLVNDDGTVIRNPKIDPPAGGSPRPPPINFTGGPVEIDGGEWNGKGFFSSGLIGSEPFSKYSLTFTRPGTYKYACLIHPPMVGTVTVRA